MLLEHPFHSSNTSCSSCLFSAIFAKSSAYTIFLRRSTNPTAILPCISTHFSTSCLNANIPSVVPFPFLNPCFSSPNSCSTLFLILPSRVLSSSFMMWLRNAMPLYFPGPAHLPSTLPSTILGQLALFATRLLLYLSSYMYSLQTDQHTLLYRLDRVHRICVCRHWKLKLIECYCFCILPTQMQKFPLRMKDRNHSGDSITPLSVHITPKTVSMLATFD